jgi:hypothetical protein
MSLPDATRSDRVYPLLQNLDLENLAFATMQGTGQTLNIEEMNEDELRRLVLVNLARLTVKGEWNGLLSAGSPASEKVPMITAQWTSADGTMNSFSPASGFALDIDIESMDAGVGLYLVPFIAPVAGTISGMAIRTFATVSGGSEPKAAIYSSNDDGTPNAKLTEATFGTTAALQVQTSLTGSATLVSGDQYWCAFIVQDASQNYYTVNIEAGASLSLWPKESPASGWNLNQNQYLWIDTGTTTFPTSITNSNFSLQGGTQDFPNIAYILT